MTKITFSLDQFSYVDHSYADGIFTVQFVPLDGGTIVAFTDEYIVGSNVSRTMSVEAVRARPQVRWDEIVDVMDANDVNRCEIMFVGLVYPETSKIGATGFGIVDFEDVLNAVGKPLARDIGILEWLERRDIRESENTPEFAKTLLKLNGVPEHIVGCIIRKIY